MQCPCPCRPGAGTPPDCAALVEAATRGPGRACSSPSSCRRPPLPPPPPSPAAAAALAAGQVRAGLARQDAPPDPGSTAGAAAAAPGPASSSASVSPSAPHSVGRTCCGTQPAGCSLRLVVVRVAEAGGGCAGCRLATLRLPDPDRKVTAEHPRAFGLTWLTGSASAVRGRGTLRALLALALLRWRGGPLGLCMQRTAKGGAGRQLLSCGAAAAAPGREVCWPAQGADVWQAPLSQLLGGCALPAAGAREQHARPGRTPGSSHPQGACSRTDHAKVGAHGLQHTPNSTVDCRRGRAWHLRVRARVRACAVFSQLA